MANFIITPNMQLPNPVPGVDPGPDYANNQYSATSIIDRHNHSPGNGVQIQPNGININIDLTFNSNNATNLRSARFTSQGAPLSLASDLGCIYVSGNELWYNDEAGNQVQLTASGVVNATSSGISSGTASASFSGGVLVVKSSSVSGANVLMQSLELTNSGNLTNILTVEAPTLSGSASQTLPIIPGATGFMTMDSSGNMGASIPVSQGIGTSNIADGAITNPKLSALNIVKSASSGAFTGTATTPTQVTNLTATITTSGRPVMIMLQPFPGATSPFVGMGVIDVPPGPATAIGMTAYLFNGSGVLTQVNIQTEGASVNPMEIIVPPALSYIDSPAAGTIVYSIQYTINTLSNAATALFYNCQLVVYEL